MKKLSNIKNRKVAKSQKGFALIATVTVTVLLMLVGLAMFSLASVTTKIASTDKAINEARQNARLSLMMAIGQLQSLTGPDTRVTASSRMFDDPDTPTVNTSVEVLGVWRSWEGTDRDSVGRPTIPDYDSKMQTGDPASEPDDANGDGRFLGWLGSGATAADVNDLSDYSQSASGDFIHMLGEGSVENDIDHVYVKPRYINTEEGSGAIAWWTSGNASKATINVDREELPTSEVEWHERVRSNGRADAEYFGLAGVDDLTVGTNIPSRATLSLVVGATETRKFHDITTYSRGLLTNAATGGWKKDLSLFSEQFSELPDSSLPTLTHEPGSEITSEKITGNSLSSVQRSEGLLYPWREYRSLNNAAWGQVPPICSWTSLVDYATQYKSLNSSGSARTAIPSTIANIGNDRFEFQDQVRRMPVMARIQWVFSLCSEIHVTGLYTPGVMVTPVVTIWNPYNVELSFNQYSARISRQGIAPLRFSFQLGSRTPYALTSLSDIIGSGRFTFDLPATTLAPGATQIYSLADTAARNDGSDSVTLTPGYTPGGGYRYYGINSGAEVRGQPNDSLSIAQVAYSDNGEGSIGIWIDTTIDGKNQAVRMGFRTDELGGEDVLEALYPTLNQAIEADRLISISGDGLNTQAFASAVFGYRMATPISNSPNHTHLFSKGMLQANPLTFYSEVGNQDNGASLTSLANSGVFHPVNAPYDFAFLEVNGWNDTQFLPQYELSTNSSYIVSGVEADNGLTRSVMAELPTRPLQSLAQLQHFDARNNNPIPPFQYNLIGNGSAHPLFEPNQIEIPTTTNSGMINDDTYLLNSVLFDDWCVTSIAPDLDDFSSSEDRDIEEVYEDHVNGDEPLPNRFYIATNDADSDSVSSNDAEYRDTDKFAYEAITSELEVEGAFNVNSVSVDAWKSLLRHSRDTETPYIASTGETLSEAGTFPYPRTSIAGDRSVLSGSTQSNTLNADAAAFAGVPDLTEIQIDALAEQIVSQIRQRGPFLSLSEFVNRQLTDDEDLAIGSTIQKALDNLADSSNDAENPYSVIQSLSHEITSIPPGRHDYKFEEAALGSSSFGVPGWIRQADILTPLAPIMTVRDDTFTIRAYGDARDNNDKIIATAWCEATVQRKADYVDPIDDNTVSPYSSEMESDDNKRYGRKYVLISFRWLNKEEI